MTSTQTALAESSLMPTDKRHDFLIKCIIIRLARSGSKLLRLIQGKRQNTKTAAVLEEIPELSDGMQASDKHVVDLSNLAMCLCHYL